MSLRQLVLCLRSHGVPVNYIAWIVVLADGPATAVQIANDIGRSDRQVRRVIKEELHAWVEEAGDGRFRLRSKTSAALTMTKTTPYLPKQDYPSGLEIPESGRSNENQGTSWEEGISRDNGAEGSLQALPRDTGLVNKMGITPVGSNVDSGAKQAETGRTRRSHKSWNVLQDSSGETLHSGVDDIDRLPIRIGQPIPAGAPSRILMVAQTAHDVGRVEGLKLADMYWAVDSVMTVFPQVQDDRFVSLAWEAAIEMHHGLLNRYIKHPLAYFTETFRQKIKEKVLGHKRPATRRTPAA